MSKKRPPNSSSLFFDSFSIPPPATKPTQPSWAVKKTPSKSAIVYCEGHFGGIIGKTANGLVRHSEKYEIISIIDSEKAGQDAGEVLDGEPNGIPIWHNLDSALSDASQIPDAFIFGIAPASGVLSPDERTLLLRAIKHGMNIINGLHEFLNDDPEFAAASAEAGVVIRDVCKPRDEKDLKVFSGRISEVACPRIAVLGTDCASGKRTTATILTSALKELGINAIMIGTGQTSLIQGDRYGLTLDTISSQFCAGELEATIIAAFEKEGPDVILIEGQGSLSHPDSSISSAILKGSCPQGVLLQHAPGRQYRCDSADIPMPTPASEIKLIETVAETKVIGLAISHEDMTDTEVSTAIERYEDEFGIPATDSLTRAPAKLVEMVLSAFPQVGEKTH